MATTYELARKYYPRLLDKPRIAALVDAGRLTPAQYQEIVGETYVKES